MSTRWDPTETVAALRRARDETSIRHRGRIHEMPSRDAMRSVLDGLRTALFPSHLGRTDLTEDAVDELVASALRETMPQLFEQVRRALFFASDASVAGDASLRARAEEITQQLARSLPALRVLLAGDARAAYDGDPAATSLAEVVVCYPGFRALVHHRIAHEIHRAGLPFLARLVSELAHSETGIDIHPGATIGPRFFVDHGTGVVIGETAVVGANVRIYQAVTLGARRFEADAEGRLVKGRRRHPTVEDDVVIYAGATLLGPITIGARATIGGSVWVDEDVPPGTIVTQARPRARG